MSVEPDCETPFEVSACLPLSADEIASPAVQHLLFGMREAIEALARRPDGRERAGITLLSMLSDALGVRFVVGSDTCITPSCAALRVIVDQLSRGH